MNTLLSYLLTTTLLLSTIAICGHGAARQAQPPLSAPAEAGATTGNIKGHLLTTAGEPVPSATIRLRRTGRRDVVSASNAEGQFIFSNLEPAKAMLVAISGASTAVSYIEIKPGENLLNMRLNEQNSQAPTQTGNITEVAATLTASVNNTRPDDHLPPAENHTAASTLSDPIPDKSRESAPPANEKSSQPPSTQEGRLDNFCQPGPGRDYPLDLTSPAPLVNVVEDIIKEFNVNIAVDPAVQQTPVRLQITAPWTSVLNLILQQNDLEAQCLPGNIVRILSHAKLEELQIRSRKNSPLVRATFTLKNIPPTSSAPVGLNGQPQQGGGAQGEASADSIEQAINDILKADGETRGVVRRIPNTNEFMVIGTQAQLDDISELIKRVDRPAPRIEINTLVYTVSEDALKDLGIQIAAIGQSGDSIFGLTTTPSITSGTGSTSDTGGSTFGVQPGLIPSLPGSNPTGGLAAAAANTLLGGTTLLGNLQFNAMFSLVNTKGAVTSQGRGKAVVRNGGIVEIRAGQSIPVVTTGVGGGAVIPVGNIQYIPATRLIRVTPQVGEPGPDGRQRIVLTIQLENNTVNTTLGTFGGATLPAIDTQSMQTELTLADNETAILGGVAVDTTGNSKNRTPGLSSIPGIGRLFERNQTTLNRQKLYFAIRAVVIPADTPVSNPKDAPADAIVSFPPPPSPAKPSPFDIPKKQRK